jgi:EAL domain-containing protein (putative c-di-GMP-specific phosphodiesterase class I)
MVRINQEAAALLGRVASQAADRAGLEASFHGAMHSLWMAYHPIVSVEARKVYGYEALLRSDEPALPHPGAVIEAAERLGQVDALGRATRERAARPFSAAPDDAVLFVNLHPSDLLDPLLTSPEAPLTKLAKRVVLEVTERSSLNHVTDIRARVSHLRALGFRIAIDDLGAGYAGLTSFAQLEPEFVKLDMTLIRDVHINRVKQRVIRSMVTLAKEMGILVVAEGIESAAERDVVVGLGCDLLQGFYFARPGRPFPDVRW